MAAPDRQPKSDATGALTPAQVALGLGVAASAWMVVELVRRLLW